MAAAFPDPVQPGDLEAARNAHAAIGRLLGPDEVQVGAGGARRPGA